MERIAVIGAGAWGTALAALLGGKGLDVLLWAFEPDVARDINARHANPLSLPEIALPGTVRATDDLREALRDQGVMHQ